MVDAARQMLDELMGRNRNLHPDQAPKCVSWEDPDLCQYFLVQFCPHELFVNTRADLGPCDRIHDEEAKRQYEKAKPSVLKRQFEDEFLYFCNSMLNDVDRKILKGKQRLALIQKDQAPSSHVSRYRDQLNNLNARIKKLLAEAEEAGTRGDVDQAQDLMILCEQLKDERDVLISQENSAEKDEKTSSPDNEPNTSSSPSHANDLDAIEKSPNMDSYSKDDDETSSNATSQNTLRAWIKDIGHLPEKQMEVCEVCGAFLIVGDAQQRIEDHLMGKQHLGYSKLRKAVEDIHLRRQTERVTDDDRRVREDRSQSYRSFDGDRRRERDVERDRDFHERSRAHGSSRRHENDRHRRHHKSHHRRRSHSRSRSHRNSHDRYSRSRSRSHY